jgi:CheY-like chemotaxis protein
MSGKWVVEGVNSGEGAVEQMQLQAYDVIVTDMRMPGMDGALLLQTVSRRWPQTIRIVLSGYADLKQIARLVPYAHQYLSKPCDPRQLEGVIDRCLQLHDLLHGAELRAIVGRIHKLPSLPRIYSALQEAVRSDKITISEVARLVATDSAIAARVLQLVNSAFFRLARRITNIEQAISYLGFTAIRNVAASVELFAQWEADSRSPLDPEKYWRRSVLRISRKPWNSPQQRASRFTKRRPESLEPLMPRSVPTCSESGACPIRSSKRWPIITSRIGLHKLSLTYWPLWPSRMRWSRRVTRSPPM